MKIRNAVLFVVLLLSMVSSAHATYFTFEYTGWHTSGYGELTGTSIGGGKFAITDGSITDSQFGTLQLYKHYTVTDYLTSPENAFHYNNIVSWPNTPYVDMYGLLFTNQNHHEQINLWGYDWGLGANNIYTICVYDDHEYVWSAFVHLNMEDPPSPGPSSVPEPTTMVLFGMGLAGIAGLRLKRK